MQVEGIQEVHELHVWQLTATRIIATTHIRCRNPSDYIAIAVRVKQLFHDEGIHSTTVQPEFAEMVSYIHLYSPYNTVAQANNIGTSKNTTNKKIVPLYLA